MTAQLQPSFYTERSNWPISTHVTNLRVILDIIDMLNHFEKIGLGYVYRSLNRCAHNLAKALVLLGSFEWFGQRKAFLVRWVGVFLCCSSSFVCWVFVLLNEICFLKNKKTTNFRASANPLPWFTVALSPANHNAKANVFMKGTP